MSLKVFGREAVIYGIGRITLRASAFLLLPIYTHAMSINDFGLLSTLLIIIQVMMIFMSSGMANSLIRYMNEDEMKNKLGNLLCTSSFINILGGLIITVVSMSILIPLFRKILHQNDVHKLIFLTCCAALFNSLCLHFTTYYRGQNHAYKFMMIGILSAVTLIITNLIFLYGINMGIVGALTAYIVTYSIILFYIAYGILSESGLGFSLSFLQKLLKFGIPLVFSQFALFIISGGSIFFLSYFCGLNTVAIYSLGYKLGGLIAITTIIPFHLAFQPYVFANPKNSEISKKISLLLTYFAMAITFMTFITLYGSRILLPIIAPPAYSSAFLVILLTVPQTLFYGIYIFSETLISSVNRTFLIGFITVLCAILSIFLNYILIPMMNWYGAIIGTTIPYIIAGTVLFKIGLILFPTDVVIDWRRISIIISLLISVLIIFFITKALNLIVLSFVIMLVCLCITIILVYTNFFSINELTNIRLLFFKYKYYEN